MPGHFEAKKHAYRQTQDGIVVSFVIHPNDLDADFAIAALGTRYMVAFAEIGDDGRPSELARTGVEYRPESNNPAKPNADKAEPHKDRRPFASLPLSQQAGIRCQDARFLKFLGVKFQEDAGSSVRARCMISSRSELDDERNNVSRDLWVRIEKEFQEWLTDQQYAEARHG